jgi:hypothetical protein
MLNVTYKPLVLSVVTLNVIRLNVIMLSVVAPTPGLGHKHWTRLEKLARDKHSSLLQKFVNYG